MPKYDYNCKSCKTITTVDKSMSDPHPDTCGCGGILTRLFAPVGVVFNGTGFYKTDSRKA